MRLVIARPSPRQCVLIIRCDELRHRRLPDIGGVEEAWGGRSSMEFRAVVYFMGAASKKC